MSRKADRRSRVGFTLLEALLALSLTAMAGAVLLLAVETSLHSNMDALEQMQALGLAEQLMDEILGQRYKATNVDPYQTSLGPGSHELKQLPDGTRVYELYDDVDDFHQYWAIPPRDKWGVPLGQDDGQGGLRPQAFQAASHKLSGWAHISLVTYANESKLYENLPSGQTSNFRAIEVRIYRKRRDRWEQVTKLRRVIAYVPPPG